MAAMLRRTSAALAAALLVGCANQPPPPPSQGAGGFACAEPTVGPLPEWARAGFTPPDQPVGHLMSDGGHLVAVPFGWPLRERQPSGRANKVLWVADRSEGGPLLIDARREADSQPVHLEVATGPGPSTIDLPAAGCWQLELSWPGGRDRINLRYLEAVD